MFGGGFSLQDMAFRGIINKVFDKYDYDRSGFLEPRQVGNFLNGVFSMIKVPITVSENQVYMLLKLMDSNYDGRISR